jgi:putative addiction module component (TIGR02574 family)
MLAFEQIIMEIDPLKPIEKLKLIDKILHSLHQPNPDMDKIWAKEAEERIEAYEKGKMNSIPAEEVFHKFNK